ncbi:FtsX-like permease family protein [Blastococcus sp. URHD0036]|uniref:FtsX-like permease family protein n=1 Tax=Blastococcus sp. URHD0036 TaxID=1380356 RepID=UPI000498278D|nr:FtsX-like permease family protein [Blastococcus sp. URHD0036]
MIRFGLRLTLAGGREAVTRLALVAVAVTLGVALLLTTLAGINAVHAQNDRYAWLETGAEGVQHTSGGDPLWWRLTADTSGGEQIGRVDLAATGPASDVPPGLPRLPGPGEYYASPALARLLAEEPADQLADRYPGRLAGTIAPAGLPSPDTLVVVVGHSAAELSGQPGAEEVPGISTTTPAACNGPCFAIGIDANGIALVLSVVTAALLFPVLIFIGTATRLSAARREQRFAALRLVGATPRQVAVVATVESTVAAVIGVVAGFALFAVLRPVLAPIPFTGTPFFVDDLSLTAADVLLVALGVPVAGAVVARLALRRVVVSPLGVTRRTAPRPPSAWRLLPLLAALAELTWFVVAGRPATTTGQIYAYTAGILVTMAGLVAAGPWLTHLGSRSMTRWARRPATLLAGRRLADDPRAGFRAISGLVLALFVGSVSVGLITSIDAYEAAPSDTPAGRQTLLADVSDWTTIPPSSPVDALPASLAADLQAIPGVRAVVPVHLAPADDGLPTGVLACAELAAVPVLGRCPAGSAAARIEPGLAGSHFVPDAWPATDLTTARIDALPVHTVAVVTDGTATAIERARTVLETGLPAGVSAFAPQTIAEANAERGRLNDQYRQLADVVVLTSLPIAGCTLAVSVLAGLNDRRRPFALLRLTGARLATLRRVVVLESAVPLLLGAAVAIGIGFLVSALFLHSQLGYDLSPPGGAFYGVVAVGLAAALAVLASTLPVLRRITAPEAARFE